MLPTVQLQIFSVHNHLIHFGVKLQIIPTEYKEVTYETHGVMGQVKKNT